MSGRIVLFGATGYTGELTAHALVRAGARPVLAARSAERLERLAGELGGLEARVADVARPETVRALVERGDVLVSTVGPFTLHGRPALEAALEASAHYLDSTGEPNFIRAVFAEHSRAQIARSVLLTAFGYDYVPGHAAAGLALRDAGPSATRVEIGYFWDGGGTGSLSQGTLASTRVTALHPGRHAIRLGTARSSHPSGPRRPAVKRSSRGPATTRQARSATLTSIGTTHTASKA